MWTNIDKMETDQFKVKLTKSSVFAGQHFVFAI